MFTHVTLLLVIFVTTVLCLYHHWVRGGRRGELINKIPGPRPLPVIGNILMFLTSSEKLWILLRRMNDEFYPIHRFWSYELPVVNLRHPDDVEAILTSMKHIQKSVMYEFLHPWLGTGLLTSTGEKWQKRRKILTPAFHFNVLREFAAVFVEQSTRLVESLNAEGGESVQELVPFLSKYTLNSVCETAMGTPVLDGKNDKDYRSSVHEIGEIMLYRVLRPWLHNNWLFSLFPKSRDHARVLKVLHDFSEKIIEERKQYHDQTGGQHLKRFSSEGKEDIYSLDEQIVPGKKRLAMLDLLISASRDGAGIDDIGIREEVDTFTFEGHDTTAMAMCFALMLLAEHKEIQDRARAEIDTVFEESGAQINLNVLQRLTYLERCIKESLRLFPSVALISRHLTEDLQLKNYLIPGGTMVQVHIYDLHRDPNFWPMPNVFDPDRFLPEQVRGRHPFAYVPFSAGPRNCIGQKFAMLELKALIANLLHNFYLEPVDLSSEVRFFTDIVIRPSHPIRVKFIPIKHD